MQNINEAKMKSQNIANREAENKKKEKELAIESN